MINIMLSGCNGKMGQVISRLAADDENANIICGIDLNTEEICGYPVFSNPFDFKGTADVIIDFSHPSALSNNLSYAKETGTPIIVATTGLSKEQIDEVKETAKDVAVFYSANMSIGVNLLIDLARKATKLLSDKFDIEIIEKHHNQKIDAPSGTALAIADAINEELDNTYEYTYDRHSVRKKRSKNEIGIHAVRGGTIVGEHDVIFAGNNEVITLSHLATSKEIFAEGAIKAAKYLKGKAPGMYSMNSMIKEV
ncbi:MAG: 4-hydroxy-tetrahydrodipicolinate reductase [Ruminococcaceae bacterium]|nr:4-hydroxy-tetrahydrodipicolinate reductase [Oscillospiraceae bacterium]